MGLEGYLEKKLGKRDWKGKRTDLPPQPKGEPLVLKSNTAYNKEQRYQRERTISQAKSEASRPRHETLYGIGSEVQGIGKGLHAVLSGTKKKGGSIQKGVNMLGDVAGRVGTGMNVMEKKFFSSDITTRGDIAFGDLWSPPSKPRKKAQIVHVHVHVERERKKRR